MNRRVGRETEDLKRADAESARAFLRGRVVRAKLTLKTAYCANEKCNKLIKKGEDVVIVYVEAEAPAEREPGFPKLKDDAYLFCSAECKLTHETELCEALE